MFRWLSLLTLTGCISLTLTSNDELSVMTQEAISCPQEKLKIGKKGYERNGNLVWEASCGAETFVCGQERQGARISVRCMPTNTLVKLPTFPFQKLASQSIKP
jgi:hypothetical protein